MLTTAMPTSTPTTVQDLGITGNHHTNEHYIKERMVGVLKTVLTVIPNFMLTLMTTMMPVVSNFSLASC